MAGAEIVVIFGLFGLVSGSLWARKAWGVWWQWDAKLTMAFILELVFLGYLLLRKFGGPGSEKLAAGVGIFGAATAPFVYKSADWWRTVHPQTSVMATLGTTSPGNVARRLDLRGGHPAFDNAPHHDARAPRRDARRSGRAVPQRRGLKW